MGGGIDQAYAQSEDLLGEIKKITFTATQAAEGSFVCSA